MVANGVEPCLSIGRVGRGIVDAQVAYSQKPPPFMNSVYAFVGKVKGMCNTAHKYFENHGKGTRL